MDNSPATQPLPHSPIQSSQFYTAAIATDNTTVINYWYLGLSYLLADNEAEALSTWKIPLSTASTTQLPLYIDELATILDREATTRAKTADLNTAWLIRQHLWQLAPTRIDNILQLILLATDLDLLTPELLGMRIK
jgi:hypothetical protein